MILKMSEWAPEIYDCLLADYLHASVANNECFIARQDNQPWDSKESQSAIDGGYPYLKMS